MNKLQTRRDFLKTSGKLLAGVALATTAAPLLSAVAQAPAVEAPAYPFAYTRLDPVKAEERGFKGYYEKGGCCRGVADAIIGQLADDVGYPFNQIPIDMFANGATGYGIGSLCGSLGGAVAAIGLLCNPDDAKKLTAELFTWYRKADLPIYQPVTASITTVADSVNCLESVGNYMTATGVAMGDAARKERCAGVTGDCAKKTVELLNALYSV